MHKSANILETAIYRTFGVVHIQQFLTSLIRLDVLYHSSRSVYDMLQQMYIGYLVPQSKTLTTQKVLSPLLLIRMLIIFIIRDFFVIYELRNV